MYRENSASQKEKKDAKNRIEQIVFLNETCRTFLFKKMDNQTFTDRNQVNI